MRQPVPFGKYLLLDRISVGGMAEVFKAKSYGVEGFEKIIAIKRILPTMGEDRDFIKMFIDEAKIAGQLAHANICQIFELGRIDGSHFIAMEYIWGKDLLQIQNRLRKIKQSMPIPMACFSIAKVLEGLDYAHRKRDPLGRPLEIVHRDCSPQNVLVSYEGEVKVIDFGIAKATSRNSRTMAGVLKGKFGYMSPEQVRGLPLDRRSDIFALGTMLYECLTGDRLFMGETDFSTLEKVRNVDIAPPRSINPDIPEAVEKVILKALAKDVDDRYQWCSEMLADLQAYLMSQDVVYTAKSLSAWLKDIFQTEIDRERAQLEQYKRIGRDGLIGGVPSAEADKDIVGQLGEAPAPEGDATTLGGPSFEDIEQAIANNAQPDVPGRARGGTDADDGDSNDFGEEAPTEIFGDGIDPAQLPAFAAAGRPATVPPPAPGAKPKPPSGRQPTMQQASQRPQEVPVGMAGQSGPMGVARPNSPSAPPMPPPPNYPYGQQAYGESPQGTPNSMAAQGGLANSGPAKTVLGMTAPVPPMGAGATGPQQMLGGYPQQMNGSGPMQAMQSGHSGPQQMPMQGQSGPYPQQQPYRPSGQQAAQPYPQYPQQQGQYPSGPGPYPSTSMPGYGAPNAYGQYPSGQQAVVPVEGVAPRVEGKRSTLVRDILIGVAIAALVLGGFFLFKILVLDKGSDSSDTPNQPKIATVHISMSAGVSADLLVDEKKVATVIDGQDIPVSAGMRHVVLAGPGGGKCEVNVKLEAGKTTPLKCQLESAPKIAPSVNTDGSGAGSAAPAVTPTPTPTPATGSGTGSATGSAASAATGSATPAGSQTGSGSGSGSGSTAGSAPTTSTSTSTTTTNTTKASTSTTPPTTTTATVTPTDKTVAHGDPKTTTSSTTAKTTTSPTTTTSSNSTASKQTMPDTSSKTTTPPSADSSGKGYLVITSKPTAKILVDGSDTGLSTPISGKSLSLAPGKHKITFVMGDDRYTFPVNISAGKTERLDKDLQ